MRRHTDTPDGRAVAELRAELAEVVKLADPIERDRRAVALLVLARAVVSAVRHQAVVEATAAGITQAEFARRRGISRGAVHHIAR